MYNWTLLLLLFYNSCIFEMLMVKNYYDSENYYATFSLFQEITKPFDIHYINNNGVNHFMFELLFSRFVRNSVLRNFYANKINFTIYKFNIINEFNVHSSTRFDMNGFSTPTVRFITYLKSINYINKYSNKETILDPSQNTNMSDSQNIPVLVLQFYDDIFKNLK